MNIGALKSVNKSYVKAGAAKGQTFNEIKFRRSEKKTGVESIFTISDQLWDQLGLNSLGLRELKETDDSGNVVAVALGVVANEDAVFCRQTGKVEDAANKGRSFKNVVMEKDLIAAGVLEGETIGNQYLKLQEITDGAGVEIDGITYVSVHQLVADDSVEEDTVEAVADEDEL